MSGENSFEILNKIFKPKKPQEIEKPVGQVANTTETVTQTGDTTSLLPMMILLMASGAGYYVIKKSSLLQK